MKSFKTLFVANMKMILRDKQAIFWMFLFPIILMLILGSVFGSSGEAHLDIGVVDLDGSPVTKGVVEALGEIEAFTVHKGGENEILEKLSDGELSAVLVLHEGFLDSLEEGKPGKATIYMDKSNITTSQVAASTLTQIMDEFAGRFVDAPQMIEISQEAIQTDDWRYVDFIVPGIIAMTLMMAGMFGLNMEVVKYREKGILRRIKVSPLPLSRFLGSGILVSLIFALIQTVLLLIVGVLAFKININGNYFNMAFVVIFGTLSFVALGFLVASISHSLKTAEMLTNAITMPMMFLAGVFFPLQILPTALVIIAQCLPLYYFGHALREVMVGGASLLSVWVDLVVLAGMGIACFLASIKFFRWE